MAEEQSEIVKLFLEAHRVLTATKCRVTAMATFNRAMTMLEALEKSDDPDTARAAKHVHAQAREMIGKEKSLHRILQVYASLMGE